MSQPSVSNRRWVLASRPQGAPVADNFRLEEQPVPALADGQILLRTIWLSLDPYMRGRMSDAPSYSPPVEIGAVMVGGTVSRVYQNSLTEYVPEGDVVYIVTDTATLAGLGAEYTGLRDYGDVFWSVRMNINDLTANFTTEFVLPEAPQYGVGRRG